MVRQLLAKTKKVQLSKLLVWLAQQARQNSILLGILSIWLITLVTIYSYLAGLELSLSTILIDTMVTITASAWGPLLFVFVYGVRPLFFFPATVLSVSAGIFFGFWLGLTLTLMGATLSAGVAYLVGRFMNFTPPVKDPATLQQWRRLLVQRPFEATLFMHLTFFPFDPVNYFSGILHLPFLAFISGTALGIIPGIIGTVSFGASIDIAMFLTDGFGMHVFDLRLLALSALIFTISLSGITLHRAIRAKRLG